MTVDESVEVEVDFDASPLATRLLAPAPRPASSTLLQDGTFSLSGSERIASCSSFMASEAGGTRTDEVLRETAAFSCAAASVLSASRSASAEAARSADVTRRLREPKCQKTLI